MARDREFSEVEFGNPELWPTIYAVFEPQFNAIKKLERLIDSILKAAEQARSTTKSQRTIEMLVRMVVRGLNDLVVLAGNGRGPGAMILSRGMFEAAVMAEYLRLNPREAADFRAFGIVTSCERYRRLECESPHDANRVSRKGVQELRRQYWRAAKRLRDKNGKIRRQWHRKSLRQMAEEIGRVKQYETPYSLAASIHHSSFEGIAANLEVQGTEWLFGESSKQWIKPALVSAHIYVLQALESLNKAMQLRKNKELEEAIGHFQDVWSKR